MNTLLGRSLALCAILVLEGCGSARRSEPLVGARAYSDAQVAQGARLFDRFCSSCHPGGEAGLGPAINNKPLPQWLMRFQVRNGLGAMPSFSKQHLPDDQLDAITEYLVWLRRQG